MTTKKLLVAFTTDREVEGKVRRVRFAAGSVVDLTDDELETLTKLQNASGKLHFREPIREGGGKVAPSEPEVIAVPEYAGKDVPVAKKTVDQLKAFLTFKEIDFAADAKKDVLIALAEGADKAGDSDDDNGL